jgi:hypothetical protein
MSSTFVERLINRTTRNKVIQIKPALTPDVLPQIFQLQELPSEPYSEHPAPLPYSQEKISSPTAPSPKQDSPVQPHTQTLSTQSKQQDEPKRPQPTENLPQELETSPTQTTTVNKQPIEAKQQLKREFTQSSFASYEPIASAEPNPQRRKADHANGSDVKEKDTVVLAEKTALETNEKVAPTAVEESEVQPTKGQPSLSLSANKERLAHADEIAKPVKAEPMRDLQFIQRKDEDSFTPKVNVKINQVLNRIEKQNSNSKVEVSSPSVMVTPRHNGAQEATTSGVASHKATEALTKEVSKLHNMSIRPAESTTKAKMSTQGLFQEFKPRLPKETETTVTIHIGRIEVHAAKEQEQPITLPRSPALSLSEYLKKRSEEN